MGWGLGLQVKRARTRIENLSRSPPPIQSSLPFCAGAQFSRDSIRAFNDLRIKIREMEDCEQSTIKRPHPPFGRPDDGFSIVFTSLKRSPKIFWKSQW